MNTKTVFAAALAVALAVAAPVVAQMDHSGHDMKGHDMKGEGMMQGHGMDHGKGMMNDGEGMTMGAPKGDTGPSSKAYAEANAKMHQAMDITFTGDADVDFVHGMIAHHQGAIDMARVVLQYGKDPEIKKLAGEIIAAQEGEIAFMKGWLEKNGKN